jgi:hypothetical protein
VFLPIIVVAPLDVHDPPDVAAFAGCAKPSIKKPVTKTADNFFFN